MPKFDQSILEKMKQSVNFHELAGVEKQLTRVKVGKPGKDVFVRVQTDQSWNIEVSLFKRSEDNQYYYVDQEVLEGFPGQLISCRLYSTISRHGDFSFWPIRLMESMQVENTWIKSAHKVAELAQTQWLRVSSNRKNQCYEAYTAQSDLPEPVWPKENLESLLEKAFEDFIIDSLSHPVCKELRGEL